MRAFEDSFEFFRRNCIDGLEVVTAFHLDKMQHIVLARDDVNLAKACIEIARKNAKSVARMRRLCPRRDSLLLDSLRIFDSNHHRRMAHKLQRGEFVNRGFDVFLAAEVSGEQNLRTLLAAWLQK